MIVIIVKDFVQKTTRKYELKIKVVQKDMLAQ